VFLGLWIAKDKGRYLQNFEEQPEGLQLSDGILDCTGDPKAYWWSKSAPTDQCIFSQSPELLEQQRTTELQVQRRCSARADCGGYIRRQTVSTTACSCQATCASENVLADCPDCVQVSYNSGFPEFVLYSKQAARRLTAVPDTVRGA